MSMNKAAFLARLKEKPGFKTKTIELPEFGPVTMRQLDQAAGDEIRKLPRETPEEKSAMVLATIAASLIDPDTNEPMFTAQESLEVFRQLHADAVIVLMNEFTALNAIDVEKIAKNSETSPNSDSATS